ncbi:SirB2 family protein [Psychrobacter sp. JCM 18903]|uniref:SirB2 family protein n=1 Tax=Psychrobacter sp. JCM 18903 TaxID=1298610 RepID=UPI0004AE7A9D|nr:SirB2 family protein [Psychrobacter sp. JCM 18903]
MKHLHMLMAVLLIALFLYQSYLVLSSNKQAPRVVKISSHILYALIIVSGAVMLMQLMSANAPIQWYLQK